MTEKSMPKFKKAKPFSHSQQQKSTYSDNSTKVENNLEIAQGLEPLELAELPSILQTACSKAGWDSLMPVQAKALPYLLAKQDLMVQSRTGSGKTGAYLLPFIANLNPAKPAVQALILVPTRELAIQVEAEARTLCQGTGLTVASVYGGVSYGKQLDQLRQGVSIVVGTPGRVLDHLLRRTLTLTHVTSLVFDEADRMLSIGFYQDMKELQKYLPSTPFHASLFSATYPPHVLKLAQEFMNDPKFLSLSSTQMHVSAVEHSYCECKSTYKDKVLLRLLEVENPDSAIIFCNTKANVHFVTAVLQGFGFNADELSADLTQAKREQVLTSLRQGQIRFLVATDVAARGIDIPELSHVILYEPPTDRESYIHRSGRTGRANAAGVVISLVDIMEKMELQRIAKFFKIPLVLRQPPTDEEINNAVTLRLTAYLEARLRALTGLEAERLKRLEPVAKALGTDPEQIQLISLLLDDCYQLSLNPRKPVDLPPPPKPFRKKAFDRPRKDFSRDGGGYKGKRESGPREPREGRDAAPRDGISRDVRKEGFKKDGLKKEGKVWPRPKYKPAE